jgi:hypothetical protein
MKTLIACVGALTIGLAAQQPPGAPGDAPADEPPNRAPHLDVKSAKIVAQTCSQP